MTLVSSSKRLAVHRVAHLISTSRRAPFTASKILFCTRFFNGPTGTAQFELLYCQASWASWFHSRIARRRVGRRVSGCIMPAVAAAGVFATYCAGPGPRKPAVGATHPRVSFTGCADVLRTNARLPRRIRVRGTVAASAPLTLTSANGVGVAVEFGSGIRLGDTRDLHGTDPLGPSSRGRDALPQ
jgi:hypothetical protein